jgi:endo-1,4-beta-xylanase
MKTFFMILTTILLTCSTNKVQINSCSENASVSNSLPELFKQRGKYFGSAVASGRIGGDAIYRNIASTFSMVTPEYEMKMTSIEPTRGVYSYSNVDAMINYLISKTIKIRGHALVVATDPPVWLNESFTRDSIINILREYVLNVSSHFRSKLYCWDAVNEALDNSGNHNQTFFHSKIDQSYVDSVYKWARLGDPNVKLFYNDYYNYYPSNPHGYLDKMDSAYSMILRMKNSGLRVDGIGIQMHMRPDRPINYDSVKIRFNKYASIGLEIQVTELDVAIDTPITDVKLRKEGNIYADVTRLVLSNSACTALLFWGFTDKYSWIPEHYNYARGAACILDSCYMKKFAYDSVYNVVNFNQ